MGYGLWDSSKAKEWQAMGMNMGIEALLDNYIPHRYIYYTMHFEFDSRKSVAYKAKHGIDFREAQSLWVDPTCWRSPPGPATKRDGW